MKTIDLDTALYVAIAVLTAAEQQVSSGSLPKALGPAIVLGLAGTIAWKMKRSKGVDDSSK